MKKFKNIQALKREQQRLEQQNADLEAVICNDWQQLKGKYNPVRIIRESFLKWFRKKKKHWA